MGITQHYRVHPNAQYPNQNRKQTCSAKPVLKRPVWFKFETATVADPTYDKSTW
jgi:hypothetical protein